MENDYEILKDIGNPEMSMNFATEESSNTSSSDPDFITDIEQDSSYEEEDTENILEEVELGHIRILNMENFGNKKRCREVNSSGDVISKVKKTKTNGAVRGKCSPDKQKPEPKEQRKILSQNREANLNMTTSKDNATSNEMGLAKVAVKESSHGINGSISNYDLKTEMESSIDQHTKISDRSFQNENKRLFAQTKHIVKVPNEDSQENKHSQKHEEGNVEPEGMRPGGKRKRKYYNNISRSINKKVVNTDDVYDPHKLSPFNLLSDEIIIKIFEFVPRQTLVNGCALSCKRLKSICYDESLWKRVDLGGKKIGPGQAGKILLRGTKIMRMSKTTIVPPMFPNYVGRDSFSRTPLHYRSVGMRSSDIQLRLTHLDLSSAAINEKCLESLFKKCWFLKKVSLENCRLNESILCYLSQNNCLEVLHLAMAQGVTPKGLAYLSNGLRNTLVEINLSWIAMNDEMIEEALLLLGNNSNTLTHLNIAGCRESLTDDRLNFILESCTAVKELDISDARNLTSHSIISIVNNTFHLEKLSTSRCFGIAPATYLKLEKLSKLKYLNVFGVMKDGALEELRAYLGSIDINKYCYSSIAKPTVGIKRTSIWNQRTREYVSY